LTRDAGLHALQRVVLGAKALAIGRIEWVTTISALDLVVCDHAVACCLRLGTTGIAIDPLASPTSPVEDRLPELTVFWGQ